MYILLQGVFHHEIKQQSKVRYWIQKPHMEFCQFQLVCFWHWVCQVNKPYADKMINLKILQEGISKMYSQIEVKC